MKKLVSLFFAVCFAVFGMCTFAACDNVDATQGKQKPDEETADIYYAYDVETDEYDDGDYITIKDNVASWHGVDVTLGEVDFDGTVRFVNSNFTITLNGKFTALDTCVMTYGGEKESDGVLRVDNTVLTMYSQYAPTPIVTADTNVMYYCKKDSKPENPVLPGPPPLPPTPVVEKHTVTLHANGGVFESGTPTSVETDADGHITLDNTPTRSGYVFAGYNLKSDGTGDAVNKTTVFTSDKDIYAVWAKEVTVTFYSDGKLVQTKKVGQGMALGATPYLTPTTAATLRGWFDGQNWYNINSTVNGDLTLTAKWLTENEVNDYNQSVWSWTQPGHLYIHYLRSDHLVSEEGMAQPDNAAPRYLSPLLSVTYLDWALWAWPRNGDNYGRAFYPMKIDMSGAVYDIDLTYTFTDCGWDPVNHAPSDYHSKFDTQEIGMQLFQDSSRNTSGFWANDGGNVYISKELIEGQHVYVVQGKVSSRNMTSRMIFNKVENPYS